MERKEMGKLVSISQFLEVPLSLHHHQWGTTTKCIHALPSIHMARDGRTAWLFSLPQEEETRSSRKGAAKKFLEQVLMA